MLERCGNLSINIDVRFLSWPLPSFATVAFLRRLEGYKRLLLGSTEMEFVVFLILVIFFLLESRRFQKQKLDPFPLFSHIHATGKRDDMRW